MDALDELGPSFPERGTLFWGQLRLRVGFGVLWAGERLQGEVFPFSIGARSRAIGSHVMSAVFPRLWNLCEDSGQESSAFGLLRRNQMLRSCFGGLPTAKLKDIEALALRMRGKEVLIDPSRRVFFLRLTWHNVNRLRDR